MATDVLNIVQVQYEVSRALIETVDLEAALCRTLQTIGEGMGCEFGAYWNVDPEASVLRCHETWRVTTSSNPQFEVATRTQTMKLGIGLPGRVWETGRATWVADVLHDDNFPRRDAAAGEGFRGAFAFPVRGTQGVLGVLEFFSHLVRPPDEHILQSVATLGVLVGQSIERRRADAAAREGEARRAAVLDSALDCIVTIDHRGRITDFNPASERTFGFSRADVIGRDIADAIIPPSFRELHHLGMAHYMATGEGPVLNQRIEITAMRADGAEFPVELAITRIPIDGPPSFTGYLRDVTEQKRIAAELLQAKEEAERANRAKSEFLSRMSHELRTPMNGILGFAQLLEMDALNSDQREGVQQILKAGRHLLDLINEVLDIARIESGHLHLSMEPVNLAEVMRECHELMAPLAAREQLRLHMDVPDDRHWHVLADRQRLKQVFLNLLSNAVKYTRPSGAISFTCQPFLDTAVRVHVRDNGVGIAEEKLGLLFEAFERLGAEATAVEGTGLGLALSQRLTQAMGYHIHVESAVGRGSAFWIDMALVDDPIPPQTQDDHQAADAPEAVGPAATVLYIEDNLANFLLIQRILSQRPRIKLLGSVVGQLGLELAREHHPNVILLDVHLPDTSGDDVLRSLRDHPDTRDIPVIVLSADATEGQIRRMLDQNAHAYLTKPIDVRRFLAVLDEALATRR